MVPSPTPRIGTGPNIKSTDPKPHLSCCHQSQLHEGARVEYDESYDDRKGKIRAERVIGGAQGDDRGPPPPQTGYRGGSHGYDNERAGGYDDRGGNRAYHPYDRGLNGRGGDGEDLGGGYKNRREYQRS